MDPTNPTLVSRILENRSEDLLVHVARLRARLAEIRPQRADIDADVAGFRTVLHGLRAVPDLKSALLLNTAVLATTAKMKKLEEATQRLEDEIDTTRPLFKGNG